MQRQSSPDETAAMTETIGNNGKNNNNNNDEEVVLPKSLSHIKNKDRRRENLLRLKAAERKIKIEAKKKKKAMENALGEDAPPKQVPKTIENQREKDETMITAADEEVEALEALD